MKTNLNNKSKKFWKALELISELGEDEKLELKSLLNTCVREKDVVYVRTPPEYVPPPRRK